MKSNNLIDILKNPPPVGKPVILPDFFLDHFLISGSLEDFIEALRKMASQGGGNLMGTTQFIRRGGNSANVAAALHKLGVESILIVTTDAYGKQILQSLIDSDFNLDYIHDDGALSSTVSIEVEHNGRRVNLMVSDSGSAARFSFEQLTEKDLKAISKSQIIVLENLNHNKEGVNLARDLFTYARNHSKASTFMDTGDPSGDPEKIIGLVKSVVHEGLVDILSVNENESAWFAWALDNRAQHWRDAVRNPECWMDTAKFLSGETGVRVDLHTPYYSATIEDDSVVAIPTFKVDSKILCGAGDAWNAGDIFGEIFGLTKKDRLLFANSVAALYVSQGTAEHPTRKDVITFLNDMPPKAVEAAKLLKFK
ncbi:MAG: carbohydrate kinase family protein [Candidatus Thorarchaeota archaeon]